METLTIELKKAKGMALLEDLEALDIIKIIRKKTPPPPGKLSDMFRGSISAEEADRFNEYVKKSRDEWERDI
ncbi:MAG: hypothetical protein MUF58_16030 [Arcicella sp.]|jgi:hypothetical protein|nr:hypothetical protein [Arcicella sp.]